MSNAPVSFNEYWNQDQSGIGPDSFAAAIGGASEGMAVELTSLSGGQAQGSGGLGPAGDVAIPVVGGGTTLDASTVAAQPGDVSITTFGDETSGGATGASASADLTAGQPVGTTQQLADYLKQGYWAFNGSNFNWKWGITNISYNVTGLSSEQQTWARQAFATFSRVANLTFTETAGAANITFSSPASGGAFANFSGSNGTITSATVTIQDNWASWNANALYDNYYYQTYIHEIGHALGLGHQGAYNGSATYGVDNVYDNDSWQLSIMSYFDQNENTYAGLNGSFAYVTGLQQADILALQDKYGAPSSDGLHYYGDAASVSGAGHNFGNTNAFNRSFTMYSPDGWVGLSSTAYSGTQTINMSSGQFSSVRGETDNISQYNSMMTYYAGGSGVDDVTLPTALPPTGEQIWVYGNAGNDIFRTNGANAHNIFGGANTDTYIRTGLTLNGDVTLKRTSQSNNGWTVDRTGSSNDGFLQTVELAQFANGTFTLRQSKSNFNFGYGNDTGATSDLLLQSGGTVVAWTMQNSVPVSGTLVGAGVTGWTAMDTGDIDGDGDADIIMQNGGTVVAWYMQNGANAGGAVIGSGVPGWTVKATGDLDNDGDYDVILQNGGTVVAWYMQNGVNVGGAVIGSGVSGWNVVGAGDFDGDGDSDVLLDDGFGTKVTWFMQNGLNAGGVVMGSGTAGWNVVGTGDFNGDGRSDVVLQNGGTVVDWLVTGGVATAGNVIGAGVAGWNVVATGDYNGDGFADVALQNGGTVVDWIMNPNGSGTVLAGNYISGGAGTFGVVA